MSLNDEHRRLAHDLRAPLGAMFMWLDVLRTAKPSGRAAALQALHDATRAHAKVLDLLLDDLAHRAEAAVPALADVSNGSVEPGSVEPGSVEPNLAGLSVLIVDDDELMREALSMLLEERGVRATAAASAAEAFEHVQRVAGGVSYDALLCDVSMPDEDGCSLLRRVRALGPVGGMPAIALSALSRPKDAQRALAAGFGMLLGKPAEPGALRSALAAVTGR